MSYGKDDNIQQEGKCEMDYRIETNSWTIPEPRTARAELQAQGQVDTLGLGMTLTEARLVLTALSGMVARGRSKTRDKLAQMTSALVACCLIEGSRDGIAFPAAHPELARFGWPAGATALRRLGIDHILIERYWTRARTRSTDACLPLDWVLAFVPAPLWRAVLTVIEWGPGETGLRLEDAVIEMAQRPLEVQTRRRPAGSTISAGTITTRITGMLQLCDVLVELRSRATVSQNPGIPVELLAAWLVKPRRPNVELCGALWAQVETAGPSGDEARGLLQRLDDEVECARPKLRYWRMRRRVVGGLLCVHGQRVDAVHALNVVDYRPRHNFGDGTIGPAMVYRPGKTRAADEMHVLALPEELARWVEEWIAYTGRTVGQNTSPMWPHRKPKPGRPIQRLNASAFARLISGHAAKDGTGSLPLLPRGNDRYQGYNAHSFRHSCYRTMRRAGAEAKLRATHRYGEQTPDDFARAVVGHDLIRGVGDVYRDLDQSHLSRVAICLAWEELRDRPKRLALDPAAIDDACDRVEQLLGGLAGAVKELNAIEDEQRRLTCKRSRLVGDARETAILESNMLVFALARIQHEIATVNGALGKARDNLEQALDQEAEIEIRDEHAYCEALTRAKDRAAQVLVIDMGGEGTLSVKDVSVILDKTCQTINTWIRTGRETSFWRGDAWTIDRQGHRALPIRQLAQAALTLLQQERLLLARLRQTRLNPAA
jgi:integrase